MSNKLLISPAFLIVSVSLISLSINLWLFDTWGSSHSFYFMGITVFIIGYISIRFPLFLLGSSRKNFIISNIHPNKIIIDIYWMLAVTGFVISLYIFVTRGLLREGPIFFNLRYAHTIAHEPTLGAAHFSLFGLALTLFYTYKRNLKCSALSLLFSMGPVFAFAERTSLLLLLAAFAYVGLWVRLFSFKHLIMLVLLFLMVSVALAAYTHKLISNNGDLFLFQYAGYGFTSFKRWIIDLEPVHCFKLVLGNVVGGVFDYVFGLSCADLSHAPPGEFNVYTYMRSPYNFAGIPGIVACMFSLGVTYGVLYTMAKKKQGYFLMLLATWIYPLLMVFYDWQFTLTTYLYLGIIFAPLFFRVSYKRRQDFQGPLQK